MAAPSPDSGRLRCLAVCLALREAEKAENKRRREAEMQKEREKR